MDTPGLKHDELTTLLRQIIQREFPALGSASAYTTTRLARVVRTEGVAGAASDLEPRITVDVEVLTSAGEPDPSWPVVTGVVWCVGWAGPGRVVSALPAMGARVRLSWLYGQQLYPVAEPWGVEGFELPVGVGGDLVVLVQGTEIRVTADGAIRISAAAGKSVHILGDDIVLGAAPGKRLLTDDFVMHTHALPVGGATGTASIAPGVGRTTQVSGA